MIPGNTPFLLARPILEETKPTVDLGRKCARWKNEPWFAVQQSHIGHYVIDLMEDFDYTYPHKKLLVLFSFYYCS